MDMRNDTFVSYLSARDFSNVEIAHIARFATNKNVTI